MYAIFWHSSEAFILLYEHGLPIIFRTRKDAREYVKKRYGYIKGRKDLRKAPFGFRMPKIVRFSHDQFVKMLGIKEKYGENLRMLELQKAIAAAGQELIESGWQLDTDENRDVVGTEFYRILFRHLEPLFEAGALRAARIAALKAELEMLESG